MSHFIVSLIVRAKSQDSVHKPQFLKRKESGGGSDQGPSAYQPSAFPLGHTGSLIYGKISRYLYCQCDMWKVCCSLTTWHIVSLGYTTDLSWCQNLESTHIMCSGVCVQYSHTMCSGVCIQYSSHTMCSEYAYNTHTQCVLEYAHTVSVQLRHGSGDKDEHVKTSV